MIYLVKIMQFKPSHLVKIHSNSKKERVKILNQNSKTKLFLLSLLSPILLNFLMRLFVQFMEPNSLAQFALFYSYITYLQIIIPKEINIDITYA